MSNPEEVVFEAVRFAEEYGYNRWQEARDTAHTLIAERDQWRDQAERFMRYRREDVATLEARLNEARGALRALVDEMAHLEHHGGVGNHSTVLKEARFALAPISDTEGASDG